MARRAAPRQQAVSSASTAPAVANGNDEISLEEHVSPHLLCPISHCLMERPVVTPSGHTYDSEAITAWLARRAVDPLSGRPLSPLALYPNRALQDELLEQLSALAARAAATGDAALSAAALQRADALRHAATAGVGPPVFRQTLREAWRPDRLLDTCCCIATWCGELVWEQMLVFTTSFGALCCLGLDLRAGWFPLGARWRAAVVAGRELGETRATPLLRAFVRLAVFPFMPMPKHWKWFSRFWLTSLRLSLLLPVVPAACALAFGSGLFLARFWQHFLLVRGAQLERAERTQWWLQLRNFSSAVTGLSALWLFLRLHRDSLTERSTSSG